MFPNLYHDIFGRRPYHIGQIVCVLGTFHIPFVFQAPEISYFFRPGFLSRGYGHEDVNLGLLEMQGMTSGTQTNLGTFC